jgi:branched-chain amino acid transport system ATP-binding protein
LGTNGAGKTTMFNVITGDLPATSGSVLFEQRDVTGMPPWDRCRLGIGRTYQTPLLFTSLTVMENIIIAARDAHRGMLALRKIDAGSNWVQEAARLCDYVGIGALADTRVEQLSHGQKKQLELGMALASKPRLLLLDEPAAGLSPDDRKAFVALIAALPRSLTVLFVEHDMEVALKLADRVTVMKDGKLLASGTPDQIRVNEDVRRLYLGEPMKVAA